MQLLHWVSNINFSFHSDTMPIRIQWFLCFLDIFWILRHALHIATYQWACQTRRGSADRDCERLWQPRLSRPQLPKEQKGPVSESKKWWSIWKGSLWCSCRQRQAEMEWAGVNMQIVQRVILASPGMTCQRQSSKSRPEFGAEWVAYARMLIPSQSSNRLDWSEPTVWEPSISRVARASEGCCRKAWPREVGRYGLGEWFWHLRRRWHRLCTNSINPVAKFRFGNRILEMQGAEMEREWNEKWNQEWNEIQWNGRT